MDTAYFTEIISILKKRKLGKDEIAKLKIKLCKKHKVKKIPTDIEILLHASPSDTKKLKHLQTKPARTMSGVSPIALMTMPAKCPHGTCTFCPGGLGSVFGDVPQSYTGKEPSTMRSMRNNYDPYLTVFNRLEQYIVTGHAPDKVELIIQGGTFPAYPKEYQEKFIAYCFKAMNDFGKAFYSKNELDILKFRSFFMLPGDIYDKERTASIQQKLLQKKKTATLRNEHRKNESSKIRCVGLTIETKPDWGLLKHANEMLKLGCTRIELGVQTVYDEVLKKTNRGHTLQDTISSTKILKDLGFKINYHMMPGLPGVSKEQDILSLKAIFASEQFRPDMLKIYPCMVMPGTALYQQWKHGRFTPLTTRESAEIIVEAKKFIQPYCRIMRVQRDIPTSQTAAGVDRTNLRQYVEQLMKEKKVKCKCIRCREAGRAAKKIGKVSLRTMHYLASDGNEFFISAESRKYILGFVRLRFPSQSLRPEITGRSALIREIHVYGEAAAIGKKGKIQHRGLGRQLMHEAEAIAKDYHKDKIVIISAVGVRNYFRKLGYHKEGQYMVKRI